MTDKIDFIVRFSVTNDCLPSKILSVISKGLAGYGISEIDIDTESAVIADESAGVSE